MSVKVYVLSASSFDGVTPFDPARLYPARGDNHPRVSATQDVIGRVSWYALANSGENPITIQARRVGASPATMEIRSANAAEVALMSPGFRDQTLPFALDALLKTVPLTTAWSDVDQLGPTDALTFLDLGPGTVELLMRSGSDVCCPTNVIVNNIISDQGLNFFQVLPADVWIVVHNFGYRPIVQVSDDTGKVVNVDITHAADSNSTTIGPFDAPTSGTARLI